MKMLLLTADPHHSWGLNFFKHDESKIVCIDQFNKIKTSLYINFPLVIIAPHNCLVLFAAPSTRFYNKSQVLI